VLNREIEALHSAAEELHNERRTRKATSIDEASDASDVKETIQSHAHEWDEVLRQIQELADEIAKASRDHPVASVAGAFAVGVLLGRMLPR
jgi:ElaB/YqjD/DUF883 family membrane-anchored ribosome-binding protein